MTSAQVVETSVKVTTNSPSQDYTHPDDHNLRTYDMTPGFKPFTMFPLNCSSACVTDSFAAFSGVYPTALGKLLNITLIR